MNNRRLDPYKALGAHLLETDESFDFGTAVSAHQRRPRQVVK